MNITTAPLTGTKSKPILPDRIATARALAPLALFAALLAPAVARCELYQWTDENGGMVISDRLPVDANKARNVKVLGRTYTLVAPPAKTEHQAESTAQALEERVERLEAQLQEQAAQTPPSGMVPPDYIEDTSEPQRYPPPPIESNPVVYSSNANPRYYFAAPPVFSTIVVRSLPTFRRPRAPHPPTAHPRQPAIHPPSLTGSAARAADPAPQFLARAPQFVGRTPQFIAQTPKFAAPAPHARPIAPRPLKPSPHPVQSKPEWRRR